MQEREESEEEGTRGTDKKGVSAGQVDKLDGGDKGVRRRGRHRR